MAYNLELEDRILEHSSGQADLVSKKTCLTFYIRTAGTSPVTDCYDIVDPQKIFQSGLELLRQWSVIGEVAIVVHLSKEIRFAGALALVRGDGQIVTSASCKR